MYSIILNNNSKSTAGDATVGLLRQLSLSLSPRFFYLDFCCLCFSHSSSKKHNTMGYELASPFSLFSVQNPTVSRLQRLPLSLGKPFSSLSLTIVFPVFYSFSLLYSSSLTIVFRRFVAILLVVAGTVFVTAPPV
jgi:hypothetical protein